MAEGDALLSAVYADPALDAPRLVYADWLGARGDRLGEFIQLQIARAAQGKRTQTRERLLFAADSAGWWRDHPVPRFGNFQWEHTERGFPARFNPGWPVSEGDLADRAREVAETTALLGWATITELALAYGVGSEGMARFLREARLVSLRKLDGLNVELLDRMADLPLAVSELELWVRSWRTLPEVTGLPALRDLIVDVRSTLPRALEAVQPSGLLGRLHTLELRGVELASVQEALTAFAALPACIDTFSVNRFYGNVVELSGDHQRPRLSVSLVAGAVEETAEALERLAAEAVASIEILFAQGGYFTKRNRAPLRARMEEATAKWAGRVTLPKA